MTVNKGLYLVLAFFLGGIGIHKFYAHKWLAGVFYIALWLTGLPLAFIFVTFDLIVAIFFKKADADGNIKI